MFKSLTLTGSQEAPPNNSSATGSLKYIYNPKDKTLRYESVYTGLSSAYSGAHFHSGAVGQNGPILKEVDFVNQRATGVWSLTDADIVRLNNGQVYFNIHSTLYPDGELRGQL